MEPIYIPTWYTRIQALELALEFIKTKSDRAIIEAQIDLEKSK